MEEKIPVIAVEGPTASGKTALAVKIAAALDGEVVSADSMQIYRGMEIATAAPDAAEQAGIPHHLIGFVEPGEPYSLGRYAEDAHRTIAEIRSRGKLPILCGGTGLYLDTVLDNRDIGETGSSPAIREELSAIAAKEGGEGLLRILREFDPESADSLHPNNLPRLIRAIEVYRLSGVTMSELQRKSRETPERYRVLRIGITCHDRQLLYARIDQRVDQMLKQGLLEEAKRFFGTEQATAAQAIGHKELAPYLKGEVPLEEAVSRLKQVTRNYAKRQLTWFRRDSRIFWLYRDILPEAELAEQAIELAQKFVRGENTGNPLPLDEKS